MLRLKRRINESVQIGDDVSVRVLSVNGNQVQIGIEAPKKVAVHREEIHERIALERGLEYDSDNMLLEDILLKSIDDAILAAILVAELTPGQRIEVMEKASCDFMRRAQMTVNKIMRDPIAYAENPVELDARDGPRLVRKADPRAR